MQYTNLSKNSFIIDYLFVSPEEIPNISDCVLTKIIINLHCENL